ncbi:hypothetical protein [Alteromonas confluentis]|uniref:Uncharacterized protein n=1 Tax=Alteromonas confluentis TaxID=1656094 RepID=A0A1E7ZF67_9ALTE|nr:hypothetical protein [Alteromonas confluentis]OFC72147.1 hypothetical protein BFC18_05460 [Alteromonas confluentis]
MRIEVNKVFQILISILAVCFGLFCVQSSLNIYGIDVTNFEIEANKSELAPLPNHFSRVSGDANMNTSEYVLDAYKKQLDETINRLKYNLNALSNGASNNNQNGAEQDFGALTKIYQIQPTGYLALPLEVLRAEVNGVPPSSTFNTLRARLPLGLHEEETQRYVGPYIIHHWNVLPEDIQSMSLPMIQSGLRQAPTRQVLLDAMASSGNVAPFMSLSPNRKTSEVMKSLLQNADIAE